jgi:hypothetical protein
LLFHNHRYPNRQHLIHPLPTEDIQKVSTSSGLIKIFLADAISSLQNNDSQGALVNLNWMNDNLEARLLNPIFPSETTKLLLNDTIKAIQSGDIKGALAHLNLINQQLA